MDEDLTDEERRAIAALARLARRWPRSLMLASMGGMLVVVRTEDHMDASGDALDPDKVLADVAGIPNTGGDW